MIRDDAGIDTEFRSILRQLITYMMEDPRTISTALEIVWIAKAIERIGDHAKNMAEYVIYIVKGTDVRHTEVPGSRMSATVLVVEDEPQIQELVAVNLEHIGHKVLRAASAEEAEAAIRKALPDVLVLDWMLPGESGSLRAAPARRRARELPILMLTARAMEQDKISGLGGRRRLPHQAVLAEGARRAHQGGVRRARRSPATRSRWKGCASIRPPGA